MSNNTEKIQIMKNKLNDERWGIIQLKITNEITKCIRGQRRLISEIK